jgi:hypothetical protein
MAQEIINVGATEEDGTGDHLRDAFIKCNDNFTELYGGDVLLAPLASPTFTGDPKAPTPTAGDNDTSIATTAFVTAAVAAASGGFGPPQGRLTLQPGTPVMTTTQAAKTTIYYTPYVGNMVPIYNGTNMVATPFTELSAATTDTTKSPAAIGVSKVNDWFVWSDAGILRIGHGPDWTDDTTRSAGTALVMVNGIWLNNASITNGPAAQRGTYVGTTRSNASSQLDWIYGTSAANGGAAFFGVWNAYNRITISTLVNDSSASWTYTVATWRAAHNSITMRASWVCGLAEDTFSAYHHAIASNAGPARYSCAVGYDSTSAVTGTVGAAASTSNWALRGDAIVPPNIGFHFASALEYSNASGTTTWIGIGSGGSDGLNNGFAFSGRF